jgi:hypothetical protein
MPHGFVALKIYAAPLSTSPRILNGPRLRTAPAQPPKFSYDHGNGDRSGGCCSARSLRFKQGALFHAHMKDTVMYQDNVAKYGVLNFYSGKGDLAQASETFRAVGYGHGASEWKDILRAYMSEWKDILRAYMDVGYEGIFSIENEDPILPGEVGVQRALYVLKNVREELLSST